MRVLTALFLASLQLHAAVLDVCASGCTYSLAQLQNAVNAAVAANAGDVVEIKEGETATGGLSIPVRGTDTSLITIRSSGCGQIPGDVRVDPASSHLAHINAPIIFATSPNYPNYSAAAHYRIECIEVPNPGSVTTAPILMDFVIGQATGALGSIPDSWPHDITFDRIAIKLPDSVTAVNLVFLAGSRITFTNSVYYGAKGSGETHCIAGINMGGFLVFRNNQMSCESMNFLLGGGAPVKRGQQAQDITFEGNYLYKPWQMRTRIKAAAPSNPCLTDPDNLGEWWKDTTGAPDYWQCSGAPGAGTWATRTAMQWTTATQYYGYNKNCGEYKAAKRFLNKANICQNEWNDIAFAGQHGSAWLNNRVDGVYSEPRLNILDGLFINNKAVNTPWVVATATDNTGPIPYTAPMYGIRHIKWLGVNTGNALFTTGNDAIGVQYTDMGAPGKAPIEFRNMTISPGATTVGRLISMDIATQNVAFNNNVGDAMQCPALSAVGGSCLQAALTTAWPQPRSFSRNVISQNQTCTAFGFDCLQLDLFRNIDFGPTAPQNDQVGGRNNRHPDYMSFSSWYNTAAIGYTDAANGDFSLQTSSPFYHWGLHGSNPGINQAEIDSVTAAVPTGAVNPNLDFLVRSIIPGTGSAVVNYSTPTTAAATLTFSRFGDATSGTVVTSTDSGGAVDRTATVSLAAGQWFMKITSAGVTTTPVDPFWVH